MKLWHEVFGDSYDYIDLWWEAYSPGAYIDLITDSGSQPKSMLLAPQCRAKINSGIDETIVEGRYLCALSTVPSYRGRGLMRSMMRMVENVAKQKGEAFVCLIPASSSLRNFYESLGYVSDSAILSAQIQPSLLPNRQSLSQEKKICVYNLEETYLKVVADSIVGSLTYVDSFVIMHSHNEIYAAMADHFAEGGFVIASPQGYSAWVKTIDSLPTVTFWNAPAPSVLSDLLCCVSVPMLQINSMPAQKDIIKLLPIKNMRQQQYGMIKWLSGEALSTYPLAMPLMMDF